MKYKKDQNIFKDMLKKYKYELNSGDVVAGTIIHNEKSGFLVNIGTKIAGYLPEEEIEINLKNRKKNSCMLIETTRDFFLVTKNLKTKQYILSVKRLNYIRAWKRIKQIYLEDIILNLKIKRTNKGGIITYLEGIQGFIPKSHICNSNTYLVVSKDKLIKCRLLTVNENKNQLIMSNKSANLVLLEHKLKLGELIYGKITSIKSYGLFINLYNINALLHNSEIANSNNDKLEHLFKVGSFIKIKIIHINTKQGKISVSARNLKNITIRHPQC